MAGEHRFAVGDVVVRREILLGEAWFAFATICVVDTDDWLVLFLPPETEFGFADNGAFPAGRHPWLGQHTHWQGHGKLMLHRPGEAHAIDVYWSGEDRAFAGWYFNLQDPYRRTPQGIDTLDHELDIWWPASSDRYQWKDVEKFEERVLEGRYPGFHDEIRAEGKRIATDLDAGRRWWDQGWADWRPDPSWSIPTLPADWADAPLTHRRP